MSDAHLPATTIVLDDDPTGTQAASDVLVVLDPDLDQLRAAIRSEDSFYVQTNSRALDEAHAVALVRDIRDTARRACREQGRQARFVLRGDSTLRGHVFAESAVFESEESILLFVPAFPAGGRITRGGIHYVSTEDGLIPAAESEYARDPVFGFTSSALAEYVTEQSGRPAHLVDHEQLRRGGLGEALRTVPRGTVVVVDAETDGDIDAISSSVLTAWAEGGDVVVRCAAPLAAALADRRSPALLAGPLIPDRPRVLVACGSHTDGATRQLSRLVERGAHAYTLDSTAAFADPEAEGARVGELAARSLRDGRIAIVCSERERHPEHNTLRHGALIMRALTTAAAVAVRDADVVVSKGGITAAEVAHTTLGARTARVLGQCQPGVSVWQMDSPAGDGSIIHQVIVPGNVGGIDALVDACAFTGADLPVPAT